MSELNAAEIKNKSINTNSTRFVAISVPFVGIGTEKYADVNFDLPEGYCKIKEIALFTDCNWVYAAPFLFTNPLKVGSTFIVEDTFHPFMYAKFHPRLQNDRFRKLKNCPANGLKLTGRFKHTQEIATHINILLLLEE